MKALLLIVALAFNAPVALAQTATESGPAAAQPSAQTPSSPNANNAATSGTGAGRAADDKALGSGTNTGTAHPNTTGSSGASGTPGVDSSTSNSH
jgi:hypothetical protein